MTADSPPVRVLLLDDHPMMRVGLMNCLKQDPRIQVAAEAETCEEALRLWRDLCPDVGVFDIRLVGPTGIEAIRRVREDFGQARILVLSASEAIHEVHLAIEAGASGFLRKSSGAMEIAEAILCVARGEEWIPEPIRAALEEVRSQKSLTPRELEVLGLVPTGHTNLEIAGLMKISERTVRAHLEAIFAKLNVPDRSSAVARGYELGLLKLGEGKSRDGE